jgi:hypothetical protein
MKYSGASRRISLIGAGRGGKHSTPTCSVKLTENKVKWKPGLLPCKNLQRQFLGRETIPPEW